MEFVLFIFPKSEEIRKPYNLAPFSEDWYYNEFWMPLTHVTISYLTTLPSKGYHIYRKLIQWLVLIAKVKNLFAEFYSRVR